MKEEDSDEDEYDSDVEVEKLQCELREQFPKHVPCFAHATVLELKKIFKTRGIMYSDLVSLRRLFQFKF